ncbi:MAG TPA: hypothetical protein VHZ75_11450 [Solirubrobacteraceae bacterium]|nr:hypothetical protein [Solirubrobacteraceae bacterium]
MTRWPHRAGECGETLIELIFAITIIATAGVVFMTGIATAAISANLQTSGAKATELVMSLGERAKQIPFIPCATADQYNDELDVEPLSGPRQPPPVGYGVEVTNVSYWTGTAYEELDPSQCGALVKTQLQRLDLAATGLKGVRETLEIAKRGPLNIPTLAGPDSHPAVPADASLDELPLTLSDTITLAGLRDPSGGTVTFRLYGPDQFVGGACTGTPIYQSSSIAVVADGTDPPYTYTATAPSSAVDRAGTFRWIATYTGDLLNQAVTGVCDQPGQNTIVAPELTLAGVPSPAKVGAALKGKATLTGTTMPTGTMTFHLYGPGDTSCATELAVPGSDHVVVSANDTLTGDFVPSAAGVYHWKAEYSGDAEYAAVRVGTDAGCAGATTVTVKDAPTLAITSADPPVAAPSPMSATAQVTGGSTPGGTVKFDLYLGSGCTGDPIFTSADQTIVGGSSTSGPSGATTANTTYSWKATYSGDAANAPATSACSGDVVVPA